MKFESIEECFIYLHMKYIKLNIIFIVFKFNHCRVVMAWQNNTEMSIINFVFSLK